jgi:membrane protease YdiL (CAAX protease family)
MNRAILVFVAITYVLSMALAFAVGLTGGYESRLAGLGPVAMLFPAIAVLVVRFAMKEKVPSIGWSRFPLNYLPLVLLLMPAVMHAVMLPLAAALEGGLPWQDWLTPQADGLYHTPESRGWGTLTIHGLVARIAINASIGLIIVSILAFFEEVGWRAWMLPRLVDSMGARRAVIVGAVIWAFWHTPFALSGVHHLDGVPAALTAVVMPIGHLGAGLVIGWLWLRTESIWMVVLAHGALNNWGQYAFKFMQGSGEHDALLLGAGNLALVAVGSLLIWRGFASASWGATSSGPSSVPAAQQAFAAGGGRRDD